MITSDGKLCYTSSAIVFTLLAILGTVRVLWTDGIEATTATASA